MKMPRLLTPVASSLALVAASSSAQVLHLTLLIEPVPGLIAGGTNGEPASGPAVDLLKRVADTAGIEFQIVFASAARGQLDATASDSVCTGGIARTPARESQYKWAGPVTRARLVLLARADDRRRVSGPDDLKGLTIGAARGTLPADWLAEHQLKTSLVQDPSISLRMLLAGHIDYWAVNEVVSSFVVKQSGVTPLPQVVFTIGNTDTYIGCNRQVPDSTVARLNRALESLRRNGELAFVGLR